MGRKKKDQQDGAKKEPPVNVPSGSSQSQPPSGGGNKPKQKGKDRHDGDKKQQPSDSRGGDGLHIKKKGGDDVYKKNKNKGGVQKEIEKSSPAPDIQSFPTLGVKTLKPVTMFTDASASGSARASTSSAPMQSQQTPLQQQQRQRDQQPQQKQQQMQRQKESKNEYKQPQPIIQSTERESPISSITDKTEQLSIKTSRSESVSSSASKGYIPTSAVIPIEPHKGPGTKGTKIIIDVNYLALNLDKLISMAYHYDVSIEPNMPRRLMPKVFEKFRQQNFKDIFVAFDGKKNAISPKILKLTEQIQRKVTIIDDENMGERCYMVAIKEVKGSKVDLGSLKTYQNSRQYDAPLRAVQFFDIILKSVFLNKEGVQLGRSFYKPLQNRIDLGDCYELWTGLFQSTVLGTRPYLNVDIAHKAFPSAMNVIDILKTFRYANPNNELDQRTMSDLHNQLKGLRLTYNIPGNAASKKTYKYNGLKESALKLKFMNDAENRTMTVFEYFNGRGYKIQFPKLPCLHVGNTLRNICLPLELCTVTPGQALMKKCTEMQTRNMIREAATSTDVRKNKILDILRSVDHNRSPTLQQFGFSVGSEFISVPARILQPPKLDYSLEKSVLPRMGQWRAEGLHFLTPKPMTRWGILLMDNRTDDRAVTDFAQMVIRIGKTLNMQIEEKYAYEVLINPRDPDIDRLLNNLKEKNIELLFVVIPDRGDTYAKVKQAAEIRCGILTQCLKSNTCMKKGRDASTISNILLKVNAKLNGTNHKINKMFNLAIQREAYMVIGADVTHPSPDQTDIPSVVGVAASHDVQAFKYNICWRLQDPKTEIIQDFSAIIKEQLLFFKSQMNVLPKRIIYFRDGVSEGQFQAVLATELQAMYRGCQEMEPNYKPLITFIVVQKRHHTRFFPGKSGCGRDDRKNNNVPPGTIVDSEITHPNETQFYLVSHQSIQGVAKPTKYCLLRDDSKLSMDDLEAFTFNLCHLFTRCNRSVSYPAPTYYAHLAAYRGRVYIEGRNKIQMNQLEREFNSRKIKENIIKGHPMYFV